MPAYNSTQYTVPKSRWKGSPARLSNQNRSDPLTDKLPLQRDDISVPSPDA